MFYVYILYSEVADKHYIGHTSDPGRRLTEHNTTEENKFTTRYRPWVLVFDYPVSESRSKAIIIEKYLKSRRSRILINKLIARRSDGNYLEQFFGKVLSKRVNKPD